MSQFNELIPPYDKDSLEKVPMEYYLKRYFAADPGRISNRLGIIYDEDEKLFTTAFLGESYRITWPGFHVQPEDAPGKYHILTADTGARILMLRFLLYGSVFQPNGDFCAFRELPSGELYYKSFEDRCLNRFLKMYGNNFDAFTRVLKSLGGFRVFVGDLAYELEVFDNLFIRFILWHGDEEFKPSGQILFSSNFPAAFSTYELAEVTDVCLRAFAFAQKELGLV